MGAVQFGVFFFAFMLGETMVNDQAARFFTPQMVNMVYAGGIACTGLGLPILRPGAKAVEYPCCQAGLVGGGRGDSRGLRGGGSAAA